MESLNKTRTRTRTTVFGLLVSAALALTGCSGGSDSDVQTDYSTIPAEASASLDNAVTQAMQWSGSTEAVVGIWSPNGDYVQSFGSEGTITSDAQFRGAQTTQPIICAVLLDLVAEGAIDLDRQVAEDLPRQTGIGDVTYRQLCDGTSGLADFKSLNASIAVTNPTRNWPTGELIAQSLIKGSLSWPGLDVHRSDTNSLVLGKALHVVSGDTVAELYEKRVFEPLDMRRSYVPATSQQVLGGDNALSGIAYPPGPVCDAGTLDLSAVSPTILGEPSSTVTTAHDLKSFYEAYLSGFFGGPDVSRVVTDAKPTSNPERDEEGTPTTEPAEGGTMRGFGILSAGPLWGYNGSMPGSATAAYHDPATGYTVVVALNNSTVGAGFASNLAQQLTAIIAEQVGGIEVPWTSEERATSLSEAAVCQEAAEE